jgi:hypothetical protein
MAELPFYLALVWLLIRAHGIEGAAQAWLVRVAVDAIALFLLARARLQTHSAGVRSAMLAGGGAVGGLIVGMVIPGLALRFAFGGVVCVGYVALAWQHVARPGARMIFPATSASPNP